MGCATDVLAATDLSVYHRRGVLGRRGPDCIRGLSSAIGAGEVVGLTGPSGSGKSSVGRAVLGLISTWDGDVRWHGRSIRGGVDRAARRAFGWIGQEPTMALDPRQTILATLTETLAVHRLRDPGHRRLRWLCETMALDYRLLLRRPFEVSGGQVQRCALMRVLMLEPHLVVLDEPTSSLDPLTQARFFGALGEWRRGRSLAVLLISHSPQLLQHLCQRVMDARDYQP